MTELTEWIERFERSRDELDETIREANSSVKAAKKALAEIQAAKDEMAQDVKALCQKTVNDAISEFLEQLGPEMKGHMDRSVQHIDRNFQRLAEAMFIGKGGPDLREMAASLVDGGPPKKSKPSGRRVGKKRDEAG